MPPAARGRRDEPAFRCGFSRSPGRPDDSPASADPCTLAVTLRAPGSVSRWGAAQPTRDPRSRHADRLMAHSEPGGPRETRSTLLRRGAGPHMAASGPFRNEAGCLGPSGGKLPHGGEGGWGPAVVCAPRQARRTPPRVQDGALQPPSPGPWAEKAGHAFPHSLPHSRAGRSCHGQTHSTPPPPAQGPRVVRATRSACSRAHLLLAVKLGARGTVHSLLRGPTGASTVLGLRESGDTAKALGWSSCMTQ